MATAPITKPDSVGAAANMTDYDTLCAGFSWDDAQALIDGLSDGRMNIAHEAVDRHVAAGHGEQLALRWIAKSGSHQDFTYAALQKATNRFASMLRSQGL